SFSYHAPAPTDLYTLSLHDALPIFTYLGLMIFHVKYPLLLAGIAATMSLVPIFGSILSSVPIVAIGLISSGTFDLKQGLFVLGRSEEHTSELQSLAYLVCRLLLEKK